MTCARPARARPRTPPARASSAFASVRASARDVPCPITRATSSLSPRAAAPTRASFSRGRSSGARCFMLLPCSSAPVQSALRSGVDVVPRCGHLRCPASAPSGTVPAPFPRGPSCGPWQQVAWTTVDSSRVLRILAPMLPPRRATRVLTLALTLVAGACAEPPNKEMHQAQGAIDAARAAGAERYAAAELAAAVKALAQADAAATQRDYRLALNHALDSRERAQSAAREAAAGRAAARSRAERLLADVTTALATATGRLEAAESAKLPPRHSPVPAIRSPRSRRPCKKRARRLGGRTISAPPRCSRVAPRRVRRRNRQR